MAWYEARTMGWAAKAVIAAGLLAVVLVAAIPVALIAGLILMLFGNVVAGLALFGASVLGAITAATALVVGVRRVRQSAGPFGGLAGPFGGRASQHDDQVSKPGDRVVRLRQDDYHYE